MRRARARIVIAREIGDRVFVRFVRARDLNHALCQALVLELVEAARPVDLGIAVVGLAREKNL